MDFNSIGQAISAVGFPIVAFFVAVYGLKYAFDNSIEQTEKQMEQLKELTEAVNNNTMVLTQLVAKMGDE